MLVNLKGMAIYELQEDDIFTRNTCERNLLIAEFYQGKMKDLRAKINSDAEDSEEETTLTPEVTQGEASFPEQTETTLSTQWTLRSQGKDSSATCKKSIKEEKS